MENSSNGNSKPTSPIETPVVTPIQTIGKSYSLLQNDDKDNQISVSSIGNSTGTLSRMKRSPSLARIVTQLAASSPNFPQASEFTPINQSPARKSYEKLINAEIEMKSSTYDGKEFDESIDFFSQIL
jgi:hypothetical protein